MKCPRPAWTVASAILVVTLAMTLVSGTRLARAASDASAARRSLDDAEHLVDRIEALERKHPWRRDTTAPPADLTPLLLAALDDAGVPHDRLRSVRQASDRAVSSGDGMGQSRVRQRTVSIAMEPLSVPEIGSVLASWQRLEPSWTVSLIDLKHLPSGEARGAIRFDVARTYVPAASRDSPSGARR